MGSDNSVLTLTKGKHPCHPERQGSTEHYELCGYELEYWPTAFCPAWMALFAIDDLRRVTVDLDDEPELCLATDIDAALSNLRARSPLMSEIFGSEWDGNVAQFGAFLTTANATHVDYGFGLLLEGYDSPSELHDELAQAIQGFDKPYLTGKKSWFNRRPVVTPELRWLEAHRKDMTRGSTTDPASVLFGAGWDHQNGRPITF